MRSLSVLIAVIAATGCTAAFRTSDGGAIAPTGVSSGRTNSVYIGDRGGLLTRLGVGALGVVAAAGSVKSESKTTVTDNGTYYTVETETTSTVDPVAAQNAADIMNAAGDPKQNFGGLSAGLEIAARDLGGDTSGWMFDFGYVESATSKTSHWGLRGVAKLAFGSMTMHDRTIRALDLDGSVQTKMGDADYTFFGTFLRVGATYWLPIARRNIAMLEGFVEADLNMLTLLDPGETSFEDLSHPSPWSVGARFTAITVLYVETKLSWSAMNSEHASVGLEAGFAF